ncbi:MAG: helix-turn-helix domain-containing protein [Pseudomonadota bacterium]|nr:helix-turn-helix domain-containing protein [Pseudomonadota bacterium]
MFTALETTDFDELAAAQEGWEIHHRPVRAKRLEAKLWLGRVAGIRVDLERWNTPLELTGTSPEQGLSFVLPLDHGGSYSSEGLDVTADRIDVFGSGCAIHALTKAQTSLISCSLSTQALDDRIASPMTALLAEHSTGHRVIRSSRQATDGLRRWWVRLADLCRKGGIPAEAYHRMFDETLLLAARGLSTGEEDRDTRSRRRYLLARRARDFMLDRQSNPPTVGEICAFLNTTERTLHYAFGATYGVSPKRFLKARRLFAARQALKSAVQGESVSDVAMRLGFWDLGYFAGDYKAMFGELPSATLRSRYP